MSVGHSQAQKRKCDSLVTKRKRTAALSPGGNVQALGSHPSRCSLKDIDPYCILNHKAPETLVYPMLHLLVPKEGGQGWLRGWDGDHSLGALFVYLNKASYTENALWAANPCPDIRG